MAMVFPKEIISFISPPGIVMYPHVFDRNPEPDESGNYSFGIMLKFLKTEVDKGGKYNEEWVAMRKEFMRCAKLAWGSDLPEELGTPVRDGDKVNKANNRKNKEELHGYYFINIKSKANEDVKCRENEPTIVDAKIGGLPEIRSRKDFYPGCIASVSGTVFPYDQKGNEGVGVRLTNVCKIDDGERTGGKPDAKEQFKHLSKGAASKNDADTDDLL